MAVLKSFLLPLSTFVIVCLIETCFCSTEHALPKSLVPQHYFLKLRPVFEESQQTNETDEAIWALNTSPGHVRVTVTCVNSTNIVILHGKNLEINESSVTIKRVESPAENELTGTTSSDSTCIEIQSISNDSTKDFWIFQLKDELTIGNQYDISIDFVAPIIVQDTREGLYSVRYNFPGMSEWRTMLATQFEPVGARQLFPCFDEPLYKSSFEIVIGRTENFTSLSNTPIAETLEDDDYPGWFWDRYERTVKLPTYLIAVVVVSGYSFSVSSLFRIPVRVYGPSEWIELGHAQLAADYTAKLLQHYEKKYEIDVKIPKVDSIWVPGKTNALECHGLILYGDQMLVMHDRGGGDLGEIRFNFNVLAHETAHIWFGNIVGSSWEEVWLKEGITTYVSYDGMNVVWPEMLAMNHMIYEVIGTALEYDGKEKSHPLRQPANTKEIIHQNMDIIGYDKGAALTRMIVALVGEETFYTGIKSYLKTFQNGIGTQHNLFDCLYKAAGSIEGVNDSSLEELMTPWTDQSGLPIVKITYSDGFVVFSQEPWVRDEIRGTPNASMDRSWDIPVRYLLINSKNESARDTLIWLRRDLNAVKVKIESLDDDWVLLGNSDGAGYYRVLYDEQMASRVNRQLNTNHSVFDAVARARLLDDQLNLGFEKYISIESALEFTKYLGEERDSTVWNCILHLLVRIFMLFRPIVNGLQSKEEYIQLKVKLATRINERASLGTFSSNDTGMGTHKNVELIDIISIIDEEISKLRNSHGLNDRSFDAFSVYMQPRINSTLGAITLDHPEHGHSPGSENFSISAIGHLESILIDWSCTLHSEWCLKYSFSLITEWAIGNMHENSTYLRNPVPTDIQAMMYCEMVDWFGEWAYEWMYTQYLTTNDSLQETWFACALACSKENNSFYKLIHMLAEAHIEDENSTILTETKRMKRSFSLPIQTKLMQHSEYGNLFMGLVLSLVPPHFSVQTLLTYLGLEVTEISGMFEYAQNYLWTGAHLQMIEDILATDPDLYGNSLNANIATIQKNILWVEEFRDNVTEWFEGNL